MQITTEKHKAQIRPREIYQLLILKVLKYKFLFLCWLFYDVPLFPEV